MGAKKFMLKKFMCFFRPLLFFCFGRALLNPMCHPFQNHYMHEIPISELFGGLQLQLSGAFRINEHYCYSFLVFLAESSCRKFVFLWNSQECSAITVTSCNLHVLIVFEVKM